MNKSIVFFILVFSSISSLHAFSFFAKKGEIIRCNDKEAQVMHTVQSFIRENIDKIVSHESVREQITDKEIKRLKRKVMRVDIRCNKGGLSYCELNHVLGVSKNIFQKVVNICFDMHSDYCGLVDTVLHEMAHTASVRIEENHNDGPNNDLVYKLGHAAKDVCEDSDELRYKRIPDTRLKKEVPLPFGN